jgi:hypothetical protein
VGSICLNVAHEDVWEKAEDEMEGLKKQKAET